MTSILRFVEVFALGTWVGSILFFSFAVAPAAFTVLSNRHDAGAVVGYSLTRLHWSGMIAGLIYLAALVLEAEVVHGMVPSGGVCGDLDDRVDVLIAAFCVSPHDGTARRDGFD